MQFGLVQNLVGRVEAGKPVGVGARTIVFRDAGQERCVVRRQVRDSRGRIRVERAVRRRRVDPAGVAPPTYNHNYFLRCVLY